MQEERKYVKNKTSGIRKNEERTHMKHRLGYMIMPLVAMLYIEEASAVPNQYYIGTDFIYDFNKVNGGPTFKMSNPQVTQEIDYPKSMPTAAINVGYNFSERLGIEASYQMSGRKDHKMYNVYSMNSQLKSETRYQSYGLDFIAYIRSTDKVDWLLSAGVGQYEFETKFKYTNGGTPVRKYTDKEDSLAPRVGAGIQINLDEYVSFRAMFRYVFIDVPGIDKMQEIMLGVRLGFSPFFYN